MTVYAMSRWQLLGANLTFPVVALVGIVFGPIFLIAGLRELTRGHVTGIVVAFFGCGGLYLAFWLGRASIQSFRLRRHQDPYFLVDDLGIECARGRFAWRDILRVVEVVDPTGDSSSLRSLIFILHEGATPQPVESPYLDGFDKEAIAAANLTRYGLELSINQCKKQAHAALATYGYVPMKAERKELPRTMR